MLQIGDFIVYRSPFVLFVKGAVWKEKIYCYVLLCVTVCCYASNTELC